VISKGIPLVVFFEIKVEKSENLGDLKSHLVNLVNQIYATKNVSTDFHSQDVVLKKLEAKGEFSKEVRSTLTQSNDSAVKLGEDVVVGVHFGFGERSLLLKLKNYEPSSDKGQTLHSYLISDSFIEISCELPVRSLRVEPDVGFNARTLIGAQMSIEETQWQKNCRCLML